MTLKLALFELASLISHGYLFQAYNAKDTLKATMAIHSFLGLNENFTELKNGEKNLVKTCF